MQVMTGIFDFEIHIACQMIGEEAQTQFKGNQANGIEHVVIISNCEEGAGFGEVTFQDRRPNFRVEMNRFPIFRIFPEWIAS
jgi:hypothetical protein